MTIQRSRSRSSGWWGERLPYAPAVRFDEALARYGFRPSSERPTRGRRTFVSVPNRFLTYYIHAYDDGTALFSWEFAIADYLIEHGIQLGSNETLNLFMFPVNDERGPQDAAWLIAALDATEARLRALDLGDPER